MARITMSRNHREHDPRMKAARYLIHYCLGHRNGTVIVARTPTGSSTSVRERATPKERIVPGLSLYLCVASRIGSSRLEAGCAKQVINDVARRKTLAETLQKRQEFFKRIAAGYDRGLNVASVLNLSVA